MTYVECVVDNDYEINTEFPYPIRRKSNGKVIKETLDNVDGYQRCTLNGHLYLKHRLVALQFIPNDDPENKIVVMHKDNNKTNNNVENLKWGTVSENTKQAYDDGLEVNDKSWNDSQSIPVKTIDKNGKTIDVFGSMSEASRITGEKLAIIRHHCAHETDPKKLRKCKYCFRYITEKDHICQCKKK